MLRIGLTGNIAAGKSTVLALFRDWGAAVVDADELARQALAPGSPGLSGVVERFGRDLLLEDGTLDRAELRRRVMGDAAAREALNAIVHPEVARRGAALESRAREAGHSIVVHDIPLLFEVLSPASFDAVVLVHAPEPVRRERLLRERDLPSDEADALLAAQMPSERKRDLATYVIDNDGSLEALTERARAVWERLQARAAVA